jgi:choline dehydrogenase-like flavoprotein
MTAMETILTTMGCTGVSSGGYPQRGDHAMGTCRMAQNAKEGVVGPNLKVFGMDNLYIMGNATFPSMGAVNPTLTLVALTLKVMESLFDDAG